MRTTLLTGLVRLGSRRVAIRPLGIARNLSSSPCSPRTIPLFFQPSSTKDIPLFQFRHFASGNYPPSVELKMPALSPTMEKGNLVKWKKKEGDKISPGDELCEIETDKANMAFESTDDGYLAKILVQEGTEGVTVGKNIAIVVENKEDVEKFKDYKDEGGSETKKDEKPAEKKEEPKVKEAKVEVKEEKQEKKPTEETEHKDETRIKASPAARYVAKENGLDLSGITPTGPNDRIVKADVLAAIAAKKEAPQKEAPVAKAAAPAKPTAATDGTIYTDVPLSNLRKIIATRLQQSKQTIPHYYLSMDCNVDELLRIRQELNAKAKGGEYKLSINDFVLKASALALKQVPQVNSSWQETSIRKFESVHINVAVNTDSGLYIPLITNTDAKGLVTISNLVRDLAAKAKANKLSTSETAIGTFTVSNLGAQGLSHFAAVINPPQAAILAVGSIQDRVVVDKAAPAGFRSSSVLTVTLSCDHRVVDGAVGAQWLQVFKQLIEDPIRMLL